MNIVVNVFVAILALLALSSGVTKIMLMQREVEFFGAYGFTNTILIAYGVAQVVGGVLLIVRKTRVYGAAITGITFLISAFVLFLAGNVPVMIITLAATLVLGLILKYSLKKAPAPESEAAK